jgi:hypothetical protein
VQYQRQETDQGVSADALGKPVVDRRDLDLGLEHPEAALDIP